MNYKKLLDVATRGPQQYTPQSLLKEAIEYFEWAEDNPLQEDKNGWYEGIACHTLVNKVRAFTLKGLCNYIAVPESRLRKYRQDEDYKEVMEMIDQVIYAQKFENAAAGLLNANIISRDLGLAEKQEITAEVTPPPPAVDEDNIAIHVHPDDPDPLDVPRPLYSMAQIKAGVPFTALT